MAAVSLRTTLGAYRFGASDPTTRLDHSGFWRATHTPTGPGTLHVAWDETGVRSEAWGAGADWLMRSVPALTGAGDHGHEFVAADPVVMRAQQRHDVRFGASGDLYHELLPTVLGQRITAGAAAGQWSRLVRAIGSSAPGPCAGLMLPPAPDDLARRPSWWFHPFGIEGRRADTLRAVARHHDHLVAWSTAPAAVAERYLRKIPGVGQWTVGSVLGHALGDPDAVAVGDYHLKNLVAFALTGRPRGTDEEMLTTLEPYRGQRGRVVRLLQLAGTRPPAFGPRQRVLDMTRW